VALYFLAPKITMNLLTKLIPLVTLILGFSSCDKLVEYSPYQASVSRKLRNTTQKNIDLFNAAQLHDSLKIAAISDSHTDYDDLIDAINTINADTTVDLVVFCGDMTDNGILREFEIFHRYMENLKKPYFTVIGNHDCLANGTHIYESMFGEVNYSVRKGIYRLVFFKDNVWEDNNTAPDFNWLEKEVLTNGTKEQTVVFAHIPPYTDQLSGYFEQKYRTTMKNNNISLTVNGHNHDFYQGHYYHDATEYLVVGSTQQRTYVNITLGQSGYIINRIRF
jgi:3',5'-cyclic-AMP phosphodiesterase